MTPAPFVAMEPEQQKLGHIWLAGCKLFLGNRKVELCAQVNVQQTHLVHLRVFTLCLVGRDVSRGVRVACFSFQPRCPEHCSHAGRGIAIATGVHDRPLAELLNQKSGQQPVPLGATNFDLLGSLHL